ncbi:hypothetical protein HHX47_DHR4000441 [Lentinula edodes]|nr:hypothetical protein HHX47_DHR4000441 [Lentinula edodes]
MIVQNFLDTSLSKYSFMIPSGRTPIQKRVFVSVSMCSWIHLFTGSTNTIPPTNWRFRKLIYASLPSLLQFL